MLVSFLCLTPFFQRSTQEEGIQIDQYPSSGCSRAQEHRRGLGNGMKEKKERAREKERERRPERM